MTTSALDELFGAEGGGFVDAEGTYEFIVKKAEANSSRAGDPMLVINLAVQGGPQNGNLLIHRMGYYPDRKNGSDTPSPAALGILKRSLGALGITEAFSKAVTQGVPATSQIPALFIEIAKKLTSQVEQGQPQRVRAEVAPQGGDGEYAKRMQVQYALKDSEVQYAQPSATPPTTINEQDVATVTVTAPAAAAPAIEEPPF